MTDMIEMTMHSWLQCLCVELLHAHGEQLTCKGGVGADVTRFNPGWGFSHKLGHVFFL
jgi:hypothetical protein